MEKKKFLKKAIKDGKGGPYDGVLSNVQKGSDAVAGAMENFTGGGQIYDKLKSINQTGRFDRGPKAMDVVKDVGHVAFMAGVGELANKGIGALSKWAKGARNTSNVVTGAKYADDSLKAAKKANLPEILRRAKNLNVYKALNPEEAAKYANVKFNPTTLGGDVSSAAGKALGTNPFFPKLDPALLEKAAQRGYLGKPLTSASFDSWRVGGTEIPKGLKVMSQGAQESVKKNPFLIKTLQGLPQKLIKDF